MPFDVRPIPIGTHRTWDEDYIKCCVEFLKPHITWGCITKLTSAVLNAKVPDRGGIYIFIRKSILEDFLPLQRFPQVVYIGRTKNLQSRLSDYLADRRAVELKANKKRNVRPAIVRMFSTFKENLEIYFFECPENKQVVYEDVLIKLFDPIFNECQKYSCEIPESEYVIAGSFEKAEPAYGKKEKTEITSSAMTAKLSDAEPAF